MIDKIINELINYDNKNNDNWIQVFNNVLRRNGNISDDDNIIILRDTVKKLTRLGYDIIDNPFRLIKFK